MLASLIGAPIRSIDTPALVVDLDALERNIGRMQKNLEGKNVYLRPHSKTHKSTVIANMQIAAGAAVMLFIAAGLEAFWSPAPIAPSIKYAVGLVAWPWARAGWPPADPEAQS